jgi:hypothetical protein
MRAWLLVLAVLVGLLASTEAGYADALQPNGVTESAQAGTGSSTDPDASAGDKTLGVAAITKMKQLMEKAKKEQTARR